MYRPLPEKLGNAQFPSVVVAGANRSHRVTVLKPCTAR